MKARNSWIGIMFLIGSSVFAKPLPWPEAAINKITKPQTLRQIVCPNDDYSMGRKICDAYKGASFLDDLAVVYVHVRELPDGSIRLALGGRSVHLQRTDKPFEFVINDRRISLSDIESQTVLRNRLAPDSSLAGVIQRFLTDTAGAPTGVNPSAKK